jgi:hypothetical protein
MSAFQHGGSAALSALQLVSRSWKAEESFYGEAFVVANDSRTNTGGEPTSIS